MLSSEDRRVLGYLGAAAGDPWLLLVPTASSNHVRLHYRAPDGTRQDPGLLCNPREVQALVARGYARVEGGRAQLTAAGRAALGTA